MTTSEMPDAQECKRRAVRAMTEASNSTISAEQMRDWYAEAQVWATLATVPEPLEELIGTATAPLPALVCPHGYQARIDTIEAEGRPVQHRYTWSDCKNPSCP